MIFVTFGIYVKQTPEEEAAELALNGPEPEPRPPPRLNPQALAAVAELKATIEPEGWARAAFRRWVTCFDCLRPGPSSPPILHAIPLSYFQPRLALPGDSSEMTSDSLPKEITK